MLRRPNTTDFKPPQKPRRPTTRLKRTVRTLLSPEQLNQAMVRESARVDRKGDGSLTMILFRLPKKQRTRLSAVRLAKTILRRIRVTDDLGWFDDEHLGLLLPDTNAAGAWRLAQSVCDAVAKRGERPLCTMYTYPQRGVDDSEKQGKGIIRSNEMPKPQVLQAPQVRAAS